jgi:membrane protease YdiL (CAAX protease family)
MSNVPIATNAETRRSPSSIAPVWHSLTVIAIILLASAVSARQHGLIGIQSSRFDPKIARYLTTLVFEWLLVLVVWWGIRMRGVSLRELIAGRWASFGKFLLDIAIAVGFLIVANAVYGALVHALRVDPGKQLRAILPRTPGETIVYLALAVTAGFCEELIFRGYLFRQFTAWTRSMVAGLVLQAIVFGLGHGYQGGRLMLVVTVYGLLFGGLAMWRRSLRPGMIAHGLQDAMVVVLVRAKLA